MQIGLEATAKRSIFVLLSLSLIFLGAGAQVVSGPITVFSPLPGSQIGGDLLTVSFDSFVALDHQKTNVYYDIVPSPLPVISRTQDQNHYDVTVQTSIVPSDRSVNLILNTTDVNNQSYVVLLTQIRKITGTDLQIASPTEGVVVFGNNKEIIITTRPAVNGVLRLFVQSPASGQDTLLEGRSISSTQPEHVFIWNSTGFLDGRHILRAELEILGLSKITDSIAVNIDNQGADFEFIFPQNNEVISDIIGVSLGLLGPGITRMGLFLDNRGKRIGADVPILASWTNVDFSWDTRTASDGLHELIAVARFTNGEELEKKVFVTINNVNDAPKILNLSRTNFTNIKTNTDVDFDLSAKDADGDALSLRVNSLDNLEADVVLKSTGRVEEAGGLMTSVYTWGVSITTPDPLPGRYQVELILEDEPGLNKPKGQDKKIIYLDVVKDGICNQASDGLCDPDCKDNTWKGAVFKGFDLDCLGGLGAACTDDSACNGEELFCDEDGCSTDRARGNQTSCSGFDTGELGVCISCVLDTPFDAISPTHCEEVCGADELCDEKRPGDLCSSGKVCSSLCLCDEDPNQLYITSAACTSGNCVLKYKNTYIKDYKALLFVRSGRGIVLDYSVVDVARGISNITTNFASCQGKTGLKLGWLVFEKSDSSLDTPIPLASSQSSGEVPIIC